MLGLEHHPNLPTEEVFTTPDPERVDGVVRSSKPRELDGSIVSDFTVTFEGGRAVHLDASTAQETMRTIIAKDEGAARVGEVALVDREGRIGALDTVFYDTLIDENAASHMALGQGFDWAVGEADRDRVNTSQVHLDFMFGSDDVEIDGVTAGGDAVPLLRGGAWQV